MSYTNCSRVLSLLIGCVLLVLNQSLEMRAVADVSEIAASDSTMHRRIQKAKIVNLRAWLFNGTVYIVGRVDDGLNGANGIVVLGGDVIATTRTIENGIFVFKVPYYQPYGEVSVIALTSDGRASEIVVIEFFK